MSSGPFDDSDSGANGDTSEGIPSSLIRRGISGLVVVLIAILAVAWYFRPWLHSPIYALYTTPELLSAVALTAAGFAVYVALVGKKHATTVVPALPGILLLILIPSLIIGAVYAPNTLGNSTMGAVEERSTLPGVDAEHPRILTRATAGRYASNSLQTSKFHAAGSDITVYNNTTYWSYALAPDGTRNWLVEKQDGTVLVNMETQGKDVEIVRGSMQIGQGMALTDNYRWRLHKSGPYLVNYQDPFMVVHGGEQYIAVPYLQPRFHVRALPAPMAYTTPSWGGVALIDSGGNIQHLSPQEAQSHPVLSDQRLVPFDLTRRKVGATSYRNGIVNVMPLIGSHNEQIEVAPVPGEGNDQPFLIRTQEGMKYVVAVEPYGDTQGVREVWVADARSESYEVYKTPDGSTLLGPRKAADYVRQAARQTDWDRFTPAEPIPVVVEGTLYWELRIVPTDASGISYVAFVNAQTSDVVGVEETAEVVQFLRGDTGSVTNRTGGGQTERTPVMIVKKTNSNGEVVETLHVYANESVVIDHPTNTTSTAG